MPAALLKNVTLQQAATASPVTRRLKSLCERCASLPVVTRVTQTLKIASAAPASVIPTELYDSRGFKHKLLNTHTNHLLSSHPDITWLLIDEDLNGLLQLWVLFIQLEYLMCVCVLCVCRAHP